MVDAFDKMGISKRQIEARIQRRIDAITPALMVGLGKIYNSIKDGMSAPADWFEPIHPLTSEAAEGKTPDLKDTLRKSIELGRKEFGLSEQVATDLAITTGKYATRAGDATLQNKLLAAALDLGAASGLDAAASMEALEQGLRGQDEGFDKLLGKNPSSIWKEFADANGLAVGKMTDTEKRMAELTAVVEAGGMVMGSYAARIETGAGKSEKLNQAIEEQKKQFGQAIQPLRIFVTQGLINLVDVLGRAALAFGRVVNAIGVGFTGAVEFARSKVGGLVAGIGKLTGNKELEAWGRTQADAFTDFLVQMDKLEKKYLLTGDAATDSASKQDAAVKKVQSTTKAAAETTEQQLDRLGKAVDAKLGKPLELAIGMTEGAIRRLGDSAREQLPPEKAEQFAAHMQTLADRAEEVRARLSDTSSAIGEGTTKGGDLVKQVIGVARAGLDAAQAFGVINASAASTLTSVINMGEGLHRVSGGDLTAIPGIIASAVNLIAQLTSDGGRRRLITDNTRALDRLRTEMGNLSLDVTGETFGKIEDTLREVLPNLQGGRGARNTTDLINALARRGLSMNDIKKLADQLGIKIFSESGALSVDGLRQLFQAMGLVEIGQFGQDFQSQRQSTLSGFDVNQTTDVGQIGALGQLGGQFSSALKGIIDVNDLAGSRARLSALFARLNAGGVSAAELGGLTGTEFLDFITDVIGRIDRLNPTTGGTTTGSGVTVGTVGGGTVTVPAESIQSVIGAMNANLGSILTTHTTLHERVATATETSAARLESIDAKMDRLIAVSAGVDRTDEALEASRFALGVQQGRGASF
jgi:TolA-binding protein